MHLCHYWQLQNEPDLLHCQFWHKLISSLFAISGNYPNLATSWQEIRKKYIKDSDKIILLPNLTTANIQMCKKIGCLYTWCIMHCPFWQLHFWKLCGNAMLPKVVHQKFPHLGNFLFLPILANWKFPILEIFDLLSSFHSWKLCGCQFWYTSMFPKVATTCKQLKVSKFGNF